MREAIAATARHETAPAGLWLRTLAFAIDYVVIGAYLAVVVGIGTWANAAFGDMVRAAFNSPLEGQAIGFVLVTLPVTLYFSLLEGGVLKKGWKATWGKRRMGLAVVSTAGSALTFPRALWRTILKFVPWELTHFCIWRISFAPEDPGIVPTAGLALVWLLVGANAFALVRNPRRGTFYDRIAGAVVVRRHIQ